MDGSLNVKHWYSLTNIIDKKRKKCADITRFLSTLDFSDFIGHSHVKLYKMAQQQAIIHISTSHGLEELCVKDEPSTLQFTDNNITRALNPMVFTNIFDTTSKFNYG